MNRRHWVVLAVLCGLPAFVAAEVDSGWEKVLAQDGIEVFLRDVPGSQFREYRGVVTVQTSLSSLVGLLEDKQAAPQWIHYCRESKEVGRQSDEAYYTYSVSSLPWPIRDRDMVMLNYFAQDASTKVVTIRFEAAPDYLPGVKGLVRIRQLEGHWQLVPVENHRIRVIYQLHSEPGGGIPGWLANRGVVRQPFNTLKNLTEYVKRSEYQGLNLLHVQEP